jgi:hypothetical protein
MGSHFERASLSQTRTAGLAVATLLVANGEDVNTLQESLRHASGKVTLDLYAQAVTPAKRKAQSKIVPMLIPNENAAAERVTAPNRLTNPNNLAEPQFGAKVR